MVIMLNSFDMSVEEKTYWKKYTDWDTDTDFYEGWNACERADWLLKAARNLDADVNTLILAGAMCVDSVRDIVKGDERVTIALDAVLSYCKGEYTRISDDIYLDILEAFSEYQDFIKLVSLAPMPQKHLLLAPVMATKAVSLLVSAVRSCSGDIRRRELIDARSGAAIGTCYLAELEQYQKPFADICRKVLTKEVFG